MRPRCLGLGRRSLLAGTAVRRQRRTRVLSFLSCVRIGMMPAELARRTYSCHYSPECVEGVFCELRDDGVLRSSVTSRAAAVARAALTPRRFLAGRIDHLGLPCDYRPQYFLLLRLGHIEVVERTAYLRSNLVELFRTDMEVLVGFAQLPARVGKRPPGRCAEPEGPHELKAWQVALLVIFLQSRVHIEFRICDDLVAEAINDQSDGVDAPETFVKSLLCHRLLLPLLPGQNTFCPWSYTAYTRGAHYWFECQRVPHLPCNSSATVALLWGLTLPFFPLFTQVLRREILRTSRLQARPVRQGLRGFGRCGARFCCPWAARWPHSWRGIVASCCDSLPTNFGRISLPRRSPKFAKKLQ